MPDLKFLDSYDIVLRWGLESYPVAGKERDELLQVDWSSFSLGSIIELNNSKIKLEGIDNYKGNIYLRYL